MIFPLLTGLLIGALITTIVLKVAASIVPGMKVDGWTPAIGVAIVTAALGRVTRPLLRPVLTAQDLDGWSEIAVTHAVSVLVLALAIALTPGIKKGGVLSVIATAVLTHALAFVAAMAYAQAMTGSVSF